MTKAKGAAEIGFPCWKVRVVVPGAVLHVLSLVEPIVTHDAHGKIAAVAWEPVTDHQDGDVVGHVQWDQVIALNEGLLCNPRAVPFLIEMQGGCVGGKLA